MILEKGNLFRNKNFLLLWTSQILSQFSISIMNFLVIIHVFEHTNSTIASSLVWISYALPVIVLGPLLATYVELHDKKKMMLYSNILQAFVVFIFALLIDQLFYISFAVVVLYSFLDQVYVPAETASIPFLVKKGNLPRANGLFFLTSQASSIFGFGFAGLVIKIVGFSDTLVIVGILLLIASFATFYLPRLRPRAKSRYVSFEFKVREVLEKTVQGFNFLIRKRKILYPTLLLVLLQVYVVVFVVNLPAIGLELIYTESTYVGLLTVLPIGFGAITGTYFVPKILRKVGRKSKIVLNAILAASLAMMIAPSISSVVGFWIARTIMVVSFIVVGFAFVSIIIPSITYIQTHTPDSFMARVFGNFWFAAYLATILPTLFSASITDLLGARIMLVIMGFILFLIYVYSRLRQEKIISSL